MILKGSGANADLVAEPFAATGKNPFHERNTDWSMTLVTSSPWARSFSSSEKAREMALSVRGARIFFRISTKADQGSFGSQSGNEIGSFSGFFCRLKKAGSSGSQP